MSCVRISNYYFLFVFVFYFFFFWGGACCWEVYLSCLLVKQKQIKKYLTDVVVVLGIKSSMACICFTSLSDKHCEISAFQVLGPIS